VQRVDHVEAELLPSRSLTLPSHPSGNETDSTEPTPLVGRTVADVERELILETLRHCRGNRSRAAKILGISIRTVRNKLNVYAGDGMVIPEPHRPEPLNGSVCPGVWGGAASQEVPHPDGRGAYPLTPEKEQRPKLRDCRPV
jgi:hypothetical protein